MLLKKSQGREAALTVLKIISICDGIISLRSVATLGVSRM